jgi:hypothetical protein
MHFKPIELWTEEEVAVWLLCVGLGEKAEAFKANDVDGSILLTLATPELTDGLGLNHMEAKKMVDALEFTKSVSDLETLAAELHAVQLEKKELEDQLVTKDERISELEKIIKESEEQPEGHQDWHPEDKILTLEHRHQAERRRMEERQEKEMFTEENSIIDTRIHGSAPPEAVSEERTTGRRHFKQEYDTSSLW